VVIIIENAIKIQIAIHLLMRLVLNRSAMDQIGALKAMVLKELSILMLLRNIWYGLEGI